MVPLYRYIYINALSLPSHPKLDGNSAIDCVSKLYILARNAGAKSGTTKEKGISLENVRVYLHPSGDINPAAACHLHNPTFYTKDPYVLETENSSNPSIYQTNQVGFTSESCLIFDHLCRRDRTEDVLLFYNNAETSDDAVLRRELYLRW